MTTIATTDRLILRHFTGADAEALGQVFGDPEVMRFGDGVKPRQWVEEWIKTWVEDHYKSWGFGMWALVERESAELIGYCGLSRFSDRCGPDETEIGFRIARAHWGRGLATEAGLAVRDYCFNTLKLPCMIAMIDPGNVPSIRVAEKIGMKYKRDVMLKGYSYPDRVYSITCPGSPRS